MLVAICPLVSSYLGSWAQIKQVERFNGIHFGTSLFLSVAAAAVSVATIIGLNNAAGTLPNTILGSTPTAFLVGSSLALGFSFAAQLVFLVVYFVASRCQGKGTRTGPGVGDEENSPQVREQNFKSVPYLPTLPHSLKLGADESTSSLEPPSTSGGRSTVEPLTPVRSSVSSTIRPISSRTILLAGSPRSLRPASVDSHGGLRPPPPRPPRMEVDGFDSWDTSAVDPQNRQTVLETSSPPPPPGGSSRFLETIPASPASRSPSPGMPFDLDPPPPRRTRSRSYSPTSHTEPTHAQQRAAFTKHISQSESHIHPLFRSDSPTSPPAVITPGTVVVASPDGGRVFYSDKAVRSLVRMRSGSLPAVSSPLSTQESYESLYRRGYERSCTTSPEFREEDEEEERQMMRVLGKLDGEERKMTPPIPDWILSAGSRTSLTGYNSRKLRSPSVPSRPASRGDHFPPSRPGSRNDQIPSRPTSRNNRLSSRPPSRNEYISSRPPSRNDYLGSRPPSRNDLFSSRPPSRSDYLNNLVPRPLSRSDHFSPPRPPSRNPSRPPSSNSHICHIDVMANRI